MKIKICNCFKKIFFLPAWLTALIAVPSFALLAFSFLYGERYKWLGMLEIPVYCLSAYALMITCTAFGRMSRHIMKECLQSYTLWNKLHADIRLRTMVTTIPG